MVHLRAHGSNRLTKTLIFNVFCLESISAGEEMHAFTEKIKQNTHQKHLKNNKRPYHWEPTSDSIKWQAE